MKFPLMLLWRTEMERVRINCKGFTLVELMSVIVVSLLIMGAVYSSFVSQMRTGRETQAKTKALIEGWEAFLPIKWEILQMGYGLGAIGGTEFGSQIMENIKGYLNVAFFVKDGGEAGPDELFTIYTDFIDDCELMGWVCDPSKWNQLNDRAKTISLVAKIENINNSTEVEVSSLDPETSSSPLNLDGCSWCMDNPEDSDNKNEFVDDTYIITDSTNPNKKVAQILNVVNSNTIQLDKEVEGNYIAPASRYFLECDESDRCSLYVQKRSVGGGAHKQELIPNVYDMQISYSMKDNIGNFICSGDANDNKCGVEFKPSDVFVLKISLLVGVSGVKSSNSIPELENRKSCNGLSEDNCNHSLLCDWDSGNGSCKSKTFHNMYFRTFTTYVRPRLIDIYNAIYKEQTKL